MKIAAAILAALALLMAASPAAAQLNPECTEGRCKVRVTPNQMLAAAQRLVQERRFTEAKPLVEALRQAPGLELQTRFLSGFIAAETGDHATAADYYKRILADDPSQTRVRLELGKSMLALGEYESADRQFRLAAQDRDLPPEVARTIRAARDVIRTKRPWRLDFNIGIAPDTNINNATATDTINVYLGDVVLPVELGEEAQARSGIGQTANISAGVRLPASEGVAVIADVDGLGTNYAGRDYDDYFTQLAAGAELKVAEEASVSVQAVGAQRWYGGRVVARQAGVRVGAQAALSNIQRIGTQIDVRRTDAPFDSRYSGWQAGAYATYERALSQSVVVSAGLIARRDALKEPAFSSTELGGTIGVGGELPLGINFGVSSSVSRAAYDAPIQIFSPEPRKDWRLSARVSLGNRKIRLFGFSPEVSATYSRIDSNVPFFANDRLRMRFAIARYF